MLTKHYKEEIGAKEDEIKTLQDAVKHLKKEQQEYEHEYLTILE